MTTPVPKEQLHKFVLDLFVSYGADPQQSNSAASNMIWSELVGRHNFGLIRVPVHLKRIEKGVLNPRCNPKFMDVANGSAILDADNGFGYLAGELAMEKAVSLAKKTGIGIVGVRNSNFFGTGAYFVNNACEQSMLGLALSNSYPKVVAHGGLTATLGTNPFAFGAPRKNGQNILVDFATSSLAGSTVREHLASNQPLPKGLAIMPDGKPITDPRDIGKGSLLPFGGAKGYGLSLMVEILAGIVTGAGFSKSVKSTYSNFKENSDSGHAMIAIDIEMLIELEDYFARIESLISILKASNPDSEVLLPGEVRWSNLKRNEKLGIVVPAELREQLEKAAAKHRVEWPW